MNSEHICMDHETENFSQSGQLFSLLGELGNKERSIKVINFD